jgi:opacity protein-like surface antigen
MRILHGALIAAAAVVGLASTASAADLAYKVRPPVMAAPIYTWTGIYGGVFGGGAATGNSNLNLSADPTAVNTVMFGPAANGVQPIFSNAYNNLANGGIGQVTNTIIPGGVQCSGFTNCNPTVTPPATTIITANTNTGYRTDSTIPTSQNSSQLAGLGGIEIGARKQFDNNFVLGIGADIMGFMHGGSSNYTSTGSFMNTNGFTGNSQALGCITSIGAPANTCSQFQLLNVSGTVGTVNSGGSASTLQINANPNWIGTVRGSLGYAFDRVLVFGSAGFAYSDGGMTVRGSYNDRVSSACSGVSNVYFAAGTGGATPGTASVGYQCGTAAINSASVNQLVTTSVTYTGNHMGMLTGFAAGGGMAYAVSDHVSLTLEGMYYNLGTERVTVTGTGTQTTTLTTTGAVGTSQAGITATPTTVATGTVAATATPFTVSKMIDGAIFKGGIQFKF